MKQFISKFSLGIVLSLILAITPLHNAMAHVVVKPAEAPTASFQTFNVSVPNERDNPTVKIELLLPSGLNHVTPTQKAGWQINLTDQSITWSDGLIDQAMRDDFSFSAQVPDAPTDLEWKAYQTYSDGVVVAWDQTSSESPKENSGPFSITHVTAANSSNSEKNNADEDAISSAQNQATIATYLGIAGILTGLIAIYFATKTKK